MPVNERCIKGERMSLETMQREGSQSVPMRASTPLSTLMIRFIGLLFLAVTVLALVWSS